MAERSPIEWCDSTINAQMGCDGCELWSPRQGIQICYAGALTARILEKGPQKGWPKAFDKPQIFPDRIDEAAAWKDLTGKARPHKPWLDGMPRVIFLNDMGDTFTASLDLDWLAPFLPTIERSPHLWLILTKRPDRAAEFSRRHTLPLNVRVGTSITSQQDARISALLRVLCASHFVSYEPVLKVTSTESWFPGVKWVIIGGGSGKRAEATHLAWLRAARDECLQAGAAVFIKQLGSRVIELDQDTGRYKTLPLADSKGSNWNEWPDDMKVRQMIPIAMRVLAVTTPPRRSRPLSPTEEVEAREAAWDETGYTGL